MGSTQLGATHGRQMYNSDTNEAALWLTASKTNGHNNGIRAIGRNPQQSLGPVIAKAEFLTARPSPLAHFVGGNNGSAWVYDSCVGLLMVLPHGQDGYLIITGSSDSNSAAIKVWEPAKVENVIPPVQVQAQPHHATSNSLKLWQAIALVVTLLVVHPMSNFDYPTIFQVWLQYGF
ncbi:uncharacterized protein LACBIDRAFT_331266 [Laccaria bicolor S238N-H82]|uniref:Predicted protein n=1 Tax=Laccaria bicolor (strain S238N-H82 / ATCC MYA-4686) TaxID=486041 RepID=B0DNZ1_LACBS|nr:uncharacterized protein LACBIDRAFT_331266 [Laccaria bicolor S238N-H82]EDR03814.1 predicted protein [Laccaria bicolor S238N-H82]|eukprot:XP_001885667.1 predicted protein [Laccaria bicolor S238N-H82]